MGDSDSQYPPLTSRHKRIFALAAFAALAVVATVAWGRMAVIQWWLVNCTNPSSQCDTAKFAFEWWWVAMILPVFAIALLAHWMTRDRLARGPAPQPDVP